MPQDPGPTQPAAASAPAEPGSTAASIAGVHPNVLVLGVTSLLTDVSSEMLVPVLPLFVTVTLGASVASLGVIEGVAECTATALRLFSGRLSDRISRRKPFVVAGYALSTIAKAGFALANSWTAVMGLRFSDRVGKALRNPPRDAIIADSTPEANLGHAFGLHRAMDTLGAALGPLLGWWLLTRWGVLGAEGYRRIFMVSAIPATLAVLVLIVFLRSPRVVTAARSAKTSLRGLGKPFARYLAVDGVFQLGNSSMAFLLLRTQGAGFSAGQVSLVYLAYNLLYAFLSWPLGRLSDRIGRRPLLLAGYLMYALAYGIAAFAPTRAGVVTAFLVLSLHSALIEGQARSLVADLAPRDRRASAYGAYYAVVGVALLPASIVAGLLWEHVGPQAPFALGATLALAAAILLAWALPASREHSERHA